MILSTPRHFKHIIITGASSGIGAALAQHYAKEGITLYLTGRDKERLHSIASQCTAKGAAVEAALIDVTDKATMKDWLEAIDDKHAIDLIIANAGISAGTGGRNGESPEQIAAIFNTNWHGVLNTITPLLPRMITRGNAHIALMSSLAGYRGWPGAPAYCASKAAVKIYGESLRGTLRRTGVNVSVICPGFVESAMTDRNDFPMPFKITAEKAAGLIGRGLERNHGRIVFPWPAAFLAWGLCAMPDSFAQKILCTMPEKRAADT